MAYRIIFLSHILNSRTPSYGNRDKFVIKVNSAIDQGDTANTSAWEFSNNHIGTHIDTPFHFDQNGRKTSDYSPSEWIFKNVFLIDVALESSLLISSSDLPSDIPKNTEMLLIRTSYENFRSQPKYYKENPGIAPGFADFLRKNFENLRCIGFDFISVTSWLFKHEGSQSHKELLNPQKGLKPILIIEDMALGSIENPIEWVLVAPVIVEDGNGGPATIFANVKKNEETFS